MKHKIGFNRLGRKASHRKALVKNMVTSLFTHERITTTQAKALAIRSVAEKMITRAKEDSVHNRRLVGARITDQAVLNKLFVEIAPRFKQRPGGYTRIYKLGQRPGDATEMVILELVDRAEEKVADKEAKKPAEKAVKAEKPAKEEAPKAAKPKAAPKAKAADGEKAATPKAPKPKKSAEAAE
jgi:large subunit ribosomal protein L17